MVPRSSTSTSRIALPRFLPRISDRRTSRKKPRESSRKRAASTRWSDALITSPGERPISRRMSSVLVL